MAGLRIVLFAGLALAAPAAAADGGLVRPGLWRTTTQSIDSVLGTPPAQTAETCLTTPRHPMPPPPADSCVATSLVGSSGEQRFERACEAGGAKHVQTGRLIGDPSQAYSLTVVTRTSYDGPARPRTRETTVTADRLGDCPPGD